jgi:hypothetical protein
MPYHCVHVSENEQAELLMWSTTGMDREFHVSAWHSWWPCHVLVLETENSQDLRRHQIQLTLEGSEESPQFHDFFGFDRMILFLKFRGRPSVKLCVLI